MFDVKLREVPELLVVTEQRSVDQSQLVEWLPGAMARMATAAEAFGGVVGSAAFPWLQRGDHPSGPVFIVVYEGNPNEGPVPVEVCAPVAAANGSTDVATRVVPAHREAFVRLIRAQTEPMSKIGNAYAAVEQWVHAHALEVAAAPREVYYRDFHSAGPGDEVFDVAFPVR
jgi:hypothetical protein